MILLDCYLTVHVSRRPQASQRDATAAESGETTVQRVVGNGGQRVITIVTDRHGNLQPEAPGASSSSSPCRGNRVSVGNTLLQNNKKREHDNNCWTSSGHLKWTLQLKYK